MKLTNRLVLASLGALALAFAVVVFKQDYLALVADHSFPLIFFIGIIGLVSARSATAA
jgi:hypothetical protein